MIVMLNLTEDIGIFRFNEPQHLHQVFMAKLYGGLTASFLYGVRRKVIIHKLDGNIFYSSISFIYTSSLVDLTHAACSQRFIFRVKLVVDTFTLLCLTLNFI